MNTKTWVFILLLQFNFFIFCTSIDTITPTQSIKDGDILVSTGETFALGFFSPGNSNRRYVGIWYYKISEQTVVWVANRDSPINGTSGVLSLNQDGNLVIFDSNRNSTIWRTNASTVSYSARLLDSGNLVLFQGDGGVVWQSFDHPTNTMLPNMKIGLDRRNGGGWSLTSWKSRDDPATGEYSYGVEDSESPEVVILKAGSTRVWRTASLFDVDRVAVSKPDATPALFNGTYVNNRDEAYGSYTVINAYGSYTVYGGDNGNRCVCVVVLRDFFKMVVIHSHTIVKYNHIIKELMCVFYSDFQMLVVGRVCYSVHGVDGQAHCRYILSDGVGGLLESLPYEFGGGGHGLFAVFDPDLFRELHSSGGVGSVVGDGVFDGVDCLEGR